MKIAFSGISPLWVNVFTRQLLRVMKLTVFLLLVTCLQISAKGIGQRITLSVKDMPLKNVFKEIIKQTGISIMYDEKLLKNAKPVTLEVKNASVEEVMALSLHDQPFSFAFTGKKISITKPAGDLNHRLPPPPPITVRGRIVNEKGEPVVASVIIKGTTRGTTSNVNGEFELENVEHNSVLIISATNIILKEFELRSETEVVISVKTNANPLDEVVFKGYYKESKRLSTGSVFKVSASEIEKSPVSNPLQTLQGRVPGLQITQETGVSGGNFKVSIRGQNSIANGNSPLYIIDGVPFLSNSMSSSVTSGLLYFGGTSPLNSINPLDIESIEVLKDADATAIYGSRGANGIILITTRKGKIGKTKIDINVYSGISKVGSKIKLLNNKEYLGMRNEAFINDNRVPNPANARDLKRWDTTRFTDWQEELIGGSSQINDAQVSISGGSESNQFIFGGGYHRETSVFPGKTADKRGSVHFSLNNSSKNQKFRSSFSLNYSVIDSRLIKEDLTYLALTLAPNSPALYDSTSNLNWEGGSWENPLAFLKRTYNGLTKNLTANSVISYQLLSSLEIKANFGFTNTDLDVKTLTPISSYNPDFADSYTNESAFSRSKFNNWIAEPQISWIKKINRSNIQLLVGLTFLDQTTETVAEVGSGFSSESLMKNISAASNIIRVPDQFSKYRYNAIFARGNYNISDKYILNVTGRRDGSSRFGPNNRFENFGAVGFAWLFSKELFIQKIFPFISSGKLRGSYGTTGNDQIPDYGYLDRYVVGETYQGQPSLNPASLFNPNFEWEINRKMEIGLELGIFRNRISLDINYYRNISTNQLIGYPLAPSTGFSSIPTYNQPAKVKNSGFEFYLATTNVSGKNFNWNSQLNITLPQNKLIAFPDLSASNFNNSYVIGEPLQISKLYKYMGVDANTGVYAFEDVNKDNVLNSEDRQTVVYIGQKFFGGLQNSFSFKGIQLQFLFQFVKQAGTNYMTIFSTPGFFSNQPTYVLDNWKTTGDVKPIQKYTRGITEAFTAYDSYLRSSDRAIGDASYVRLKNISMAYSFSNRLSQRLHFENIRIYIQGQNLFKITNYMGLDPEVQSAVVPPLRVITAGLNITL